MSDDCLAVVVRMAVDVVIIQVFVDITVVVHDDVRVAVIIMAVVIVVFVDCGI